MHSSVLKVLLAVCNNGLPQCLDISKLLKLVVTTPCLPLTPDISKINCIDLLCKCSHENSRQDCLNVLFLVEVLVHLNDYLLRKSRLSKLVPNIYLIGSVHEQTRIGSGNELDANLIFKAFDSVNAFESLEAFYFVLSDPGVNLLKAANLSYLIKDYKDQKVLNNSDFQLLILQEITCALKTFARFEYTFVPTNEGCHSCQKSRSEDPEAVFKHCSSCLPSVTVTKRGPCLVIKNHKLNLINTIDLCPVFSGRNCGTLAAMSIVVQELIKQAPPEAMSYLLNFLDSDRILPEHFASDDPTKVSCGVKLFSYSNEEQHFVIKPGQILKPVSHFQEYPHLQRVYIILKAIKEIFALDIKSFWIKKALLKEDVKYLARHLETKQPVLELFYKVANINEFKQRYQSVLDYKEYQKITMKSLKKINMFSFVIPMTNKGLEFIQSLSKSESQKSCLHN